MVIFISSPKVGSFFGVHIRFPYSAVEYDITRLRVTIVTLGNIPMALDKNHILISPFSNKHLKLLRVEVDCWKDIGT